MFHDSDAKTVILISKIVFLYRTAFNHSFSVAKALLSKDGDIDNGVLLLYRCTCTINGVVAKVLVSLEGITGDSSGVCLFLNVSKIKKTLGCLFWRGNRKNFTGCAS